MKHQREFNMNCSFVQTCFVYAAADLTVTSGAVRGEAISFADELDLDEVYQLRPSSRPRLLSLRPSPDGALRIAAGSDSGREGQAVYLDAVLTMITWNGAAAELLVLVEVDAAGDVDAVHVLPLAPLTPGADYTLVGIDREGARERFTDAACMSLSVAAHPAQVVPTQIAV